MRRICDILTCMNQVLADDYQRRVDALADIVPEAETQDGAATQDATLPNGNGASSSQTGVNGHVEVVIDHEPMPAVTEETARELVAQTTADGQMSIQAQAMLQLPSDATAINGKDAAIAAENAERKRQREAIWKPHYVDFELMQNKLVDKENGYLTTRAFEKDVERIHENTLRYRGDIGKSNAMVSECRLNIKDHFQDQQIRMDIERMAAREYARREAEKEKSAAKPKSPTNPSNPSSPVRASARRHGKAPEFDMFALAELNKKKRTRAGSRDTGDGHTDGEQPDPKRSRVDFDVDMDGPSLNEASSVAESSARASGPGTHAMVMPEGEPLAGQLEEAASINLNNDVPSIGSVVDRMETSAQSADAPREQTPEPEVPTPPFVVPDLTSLQKTLAETTSEFTLEELEQLRAMALGLIWKRRADWDRNDLVRDLQAAVEDYVARVKREAGISEESK